MRILKAQSTDLVEILALQKICYLQEAAIYNDYTISPLHQTLASIETAFKQQTFLKLVVDGRIIGSIRGYLDKNVCKIERLIVHPNFQNKGIGKQFMKAIEKEFPTAHRFELFTGFKSVKNLAFYQKLGYLETQRKHINPKLTLVYLTKKNTY